MKRRPSALAWTLPLSVGGIALSVGLLMVGTALMQAPAHPLSVGEAGYAIVDDGGPGYSEVGKWKKSPAALGVGGSERAVLGMATTWAPSKPQPSIARWMVKLPETPGLYEVLVTWQLPASNQDQLAKKVPVRITGGDTKKVLHMSAIDQSKAPGGEQFAGRPWHSLGRFSMGKAVLVELANENADGVVLADAVWVRSASSADIDIKQSLNGFKETPLAVLQPGSKVEYTIAMRNKGPLTAKKIQFKAQLPTSFVLNPIDPSKCQVTGTTVKEIHCDIPLLPVGKDLVFYIRGGVDPAAICGTPFTSRIGAKATERDPDTKNNFSELNVVLCGGKKTPTPKPTPKPTPTPGLPSPTPKVAPTPKAPVTPGAVRPAAPSSVASAPSSVAPAPVAPKRPPTPEPQKGPTDFVLRMVSRATVEQGGILSATIELRGTGPGSAPAFLKITVPPGVIVQKDTIEGCAYDEVVGGAISCYVGTVAAEVTMPVVRFSATVPQSAPCESPLTVRTEVGVPDGDATPLNNSVVSASKVKC